MDESQKNNRQLDDVMLMGLVPADDAAHQTAIFESVAATGVFARLRAKSKKCQRQQRQRTHARP